MFDEFLGLPLHVFVVHATVILLPLVATLALAYVGLPSWRWLLRWPLAAGAVGAPILTFVTLKAGQALKEQLGLPDAVIGTHQSRAGLLLVFTVVFAVAGLAAAYTLGGPSLLVSGAGSRRGAARVVQIGVAVLLAVAALLVVVQVVLTGDAGARAVWGGR